MLPNLDTVFNIIKYLFIILDLILLYGLIYSIRKGLDFRPKLKPDTEVEGHEHRVLTLAEAILKEKWEGIIEKFNSGSTDLVRLAIIEADKLSDELLKSLGIEGDHFADRLEKLSPEDFKTLDALWAAHRIRNEIAHTPDYEVPMGEAKKAIESYEAFLKEAGAL
jgi:hypothetical protein